MKLYREVRGSSVSGEVANRVTIICWYQRRCGAVGGDSCTWGALDPLLRVARVAHGVVAAGGVARQQAAGVLEVVQRGTQLGRGGYLDVTQRALSVTQRAASSTSELLVPASS